MKQQKATWYLTDFCKILLIIALTCEVSAGELNTEASDPEFHAYSIRDAESNSSGPVGKPRFPGLEWDFNTFHCIYFMTKDLLILNKSECQHPWKLKEFSVWPAISFQWEDFDVKSQKKKSFTTGCNCKQFGILISTSILTPWNRAKLHKFPSRPHTTYVLQLWLFRLQGGVAVARAYDNHRYGI